jgi:hypothetical protein
MVKVMSIAVTMVIFFINNSSIFVIAPSPYPLPREERRAVIELLNP